MRVVTFKACEELVDKLNELAREKGLPRSEVIRRALQEYLRQFEKLPTPYRVVRLTS